MSPSAAGDRELPPSLSSQADPQPANDAGDAGATRRRSADLVWIVSGRLTLMGTTAVLLLLLAEVLALETFGLLVTVISGQLLLSRVLMLGVDSGIIRLRTLPEFRGPTGRIAALQNAGQIVIWITSAGSLLLVLCVVWAFGHWNISRWPSWALFSMVAGAIGTALIDYRYGMYLTHLQYRGAALLQGVVSLLRLVVTALAVLLVPDRPEVVFLCYTGVSLLSGAAVTRLVKGSGPGRTNKPDGALFRRLLGYSFWQCGASVAVMLGLYQGPILLDRLDMQAASGTFGLGLLLSMGFFSVYNAFGDYLMPQVARLPSLRSLRAFFARAFGTALVLALGSVPVALAIGWLVARVLRPELQEVVPIFYCLSASMVVLIFQGPLEAACHYLLRPELVTVGWVCCA